MLIAEASSALRQLLQQRMCFMWVVGVGSILHICISDKNVGVTTVYPAVEIMTEAVGSVVCKHVSSCNLSQQVHCSQKKFVCAFQDFCSSCQSSLALTAHSKQRGCHQGGCSVP